MAPCMLAVNTLRGVNDENGRTSDVESLEARVLKDSRAKDPPTWL